MPTTKNLSLDDIRLDGDTQPRAEINLETVNDFAADMERGQKFPPIVVFFDGAAYWLADGFHRWHARKKCGIKTIPCEVHNGTQEDAQWYSYAANQGHGLRRSKKDKEKAVRAALKHPGGAGLSGRKIAEHVGVDNKTVERYRGELIATEEIPQSTHRAGRDGRTIDTANIGTRHVEAEPGPQGVPEAEEEPEPTEQPATNRRGVGIDRAHEAVNCLMRIPKNDPFRKRGFQIVTDFIKHNP